MDIVEKIKDLAESRLKEGQFLVEVLYLGKHRPPKIKVIADGDDGFTIDACADLSRELSKALDELDWGEASYVLEVSTPGLDHPLKLKRQYFKNIGRHFKLHLRDHQVVQGLLGDATEHVLLVDQRVQEGKQVETRRIEIPFENIEKAFVIVAFK